MAKMCSIRIPRHRTTCKGALLGAGVRGVPAQTVFLALCTILILAGCAQSPATTGAVSPKAPTAETHLEDIFEASGWNAKLQRMPKAIRNSVQSNPALNRLSPQTNAAVKKVFFEIFQTKTFRAEVVARWKAHLDAGPLAKVAAAYRLPLIQKMVRLVDDSDKPEVKAALGRYADNLAQSPPPEDRKLVTQRIYETMGIHVMITDLIVEITGGLIQIIAISSPGGQKKSPEEMASIKSGVRRRQLPILQKAMFIALLFTYRDMAVEEMKQLADILERKEMRWYHHTNIQIISDTIKASMDKAIEGLGKNLG